MRSLIVAAMLVWPGMCRVASGQQSGSPTHLNISNTSNDAVLIHIRTASTDGTKGQWQGPTEVPGRKTVEIRLPRNPPYELVIREKDGTSYKSIPFDVAQWDSQFKSSDGKQNQWTFGVVKGKWVNGDFVTEDKSQLQLIATAEKGMDRMATTTVRYDPPRQPKVPPKK